MTKKIYKCISHGNQVDPENSYEKFCGECLFDYLSKLKKMNKNERKEEYKAMIRMNNEQFN